MKISEAILNGKRKLEKVSDAPLLEAEVLFSFVMGKSKEYILARYDTEVSKEILEKFFTLIKKRESGIPLPYLTHKREFMNLDFYINESVLIPRQETESLVEKALSIANNEKVHILDIGTGSGCILISFLFYNKLSTGIGIDISKKAVEIALKNAKNIGVLNRAKFINIDFRKFKSKEKFDLILTNPPYVMEKELKNIPFEPKIALDGGISGMEIYPELTKKSYLLLKDGGTFITEIDYRNARKILNIIKQIGFSNVKLLKDLTGRDRFLIGVKK